MKPENRKREKHVLGLELGMIYWEPLMSFRVLKKKKKGLFPLSSSSSLGASLVWRKVQTAPGRLYVS